MPGIPRKRRYRIVARMTSSLKILLCILFFCLPCQSVLRKLRDGKVYVEHFSNQVGNYLNIYNYELVSPGYEEFDVKNEMACRWIQITTKAVVASVGQEKKGKPFKCRVHYTLPRKDISLKAKIGYYSLMRTDSSVSEPFAPASDGFFYSIGEKKNANKAKDCCPKNSKRPLLKTKKQQKTFLELLEANNIDRAFIGASKEVGKDGVWDDGDEVKVQKVGGLKGNLVFTRNNGGEFHYIFSDWSIHCVCIDNVFSLPLDY